MRSPIDGEAVTLGIVLALALASCGGQGGPAAIPPPPSSERASPTQEERDALERWLEEGGDPGRSFPRKGYDRTEEERQQDARDLDAYRKAMGLPPIQGRP